jgi:hypothetical protein
MYVVRDAELVLCCGSGSAGTRNQSYSVGLILCRQIGEHVYVSAAPVLYSRPLALRTLSPIWQGSMSGSEPCQTGALFR